MKNRLPIWCVGGCVAVALVVATWRSWKVSAAQHRNELPGLQLARSVDDPASKDADLIDWVGANDFRFVMGDGSGLQGYNVLVVGADGNCTYTFSEPIVEREPGSSAAGIRARRATFQLDADTQSRFRKYLKQIDFFRLKKEYLGGMSDGTQRWARVEASGKRKAVYCDNYFPQEFLRLSRFVSDRIIAPNSAAIDEAKAVTLEPKDLEVEDFR